MRPLRCLPFVLAVVLAACGNGQTPPDAEAPAPVQRLSAEEAVAGLADSAVTVLDVRTPREFASGRLDGAVHLDVSASDFAERAAALERAGTYYLYCQSGGRSQRAAEQLRAMGFAEVYNVGGIGALARAGAPIVR